MNWEKNNNWHKLNDAFKDKLKMSYYSEGINLKVELYHWELKTEYPDKVIHISMSSKNTYIVTIDDFNTRSQRTILSTNEVEKVIRVVKEML